MSSYDLYNPTRATRIIFDGVMAQRRIEVAPRQQIVDVELSDTMAANLFRTSGKDDLVIEHHDPERHARAGAARPAIVLDGRFGIGDAIHQRGVLRELLRTHDVWLRTCHYRVYQDLVERGLNLIFKDTRLHAQAKTIARERALFPHASAPPIAAPSFNLSYNKDLIDKHGSILEAMAGCVGVKVRPLDFSLPVRREWIEAFKTRFSWNTGGKPIMVYRPIVLRPEWNGANRNPDPAAYAAIFAAVRDSFFVVSVADLAPGREWIVGPEEAADVKLHQGELIFEDMAALWQEAAIVFCNAGFAPVLAQAVGTPSIVVYGGREDFNTTQRAGAHLALTLGIDADKPCACHTERHDCGSKVITLPPAIERAKRFVEQAQETHRSRRPQGVGDSQAHEAGPRRRSDILVFATSYVDSGDREQLTRQWLDLHVALNSDCDFLIVDSASPKPVLDSEWAARFKDDPHKFRFFDFGDNIGHLSRRGRDGWGRAFCKGLDYAVEHGYLYVLHIEGDSLLRVPARDIVASLRKSGHEVASIPVKGTLREFPGWVETGLMCFSTSYLRRTGFTATYNWPIREVRPTPEFVVREIIGLTNIAMLDLKGLRGDKNQVSAANIAKLDLDWVTHVHSDIWVYAEFVKVNLPSQLSSQVSIGTKSERHENILPAPSLLLPATPSATISATINAAIIVGGAKSVWDEIGQTEALLAEAGTEARWFVTNDMIPRFPGPCTAVSLHPQKLKGWLMERAQAGRARPDEVWTHVKHADATHCTEDWRGSSGLFGIKVARQLRYERIILCGIPMDPKSGHVLRGDEPWRACEQFLGGWRMHAKEIAPYVRSWSGWTAETFGKPDPAFLCR